MVIKRRGKQFISILLSLLLVISFCAAPVQAAEITAGQPEQEMTTQDIEDTEQDLSEAGPTESDGEKTIDMLSETKAEETTAGENRADEQSETEEEDLTVDTLTVIVDEDGEKTISAIAAFSAGSDDSSDDVAEFDTSAAARNALRENLLNRTASIQMRLKDDAISGITTDDIADQATGLFDEAIAHITANEPGSNPKLGDYFARSIGGYSVGISYAMSGSDIVYIEYTYDILYYTDLVQEAVVDSRLSEIYASLNLSDNTLSDVQKVYMIYNWITENVSYDYDNLDDDTNLTKYTAYGALHDQMAVCQGFANLFYRMCMDNGIDCRIVTGDAGGPHAWNIVKVGEVYYYVDSTWDCKVIAQGSGGGQEKPGTLFYFLRNTLADHVEDADNNVTGNYRIASDSMSVIQTMVPEDVTKDTMSANVVVLKDLCGTELTAAQKQWYKTTVKQAADETCKWNITVNPDAVGMERIVLAEQTVEIHTYQDGTCVDCGQQSEYIVAGYMYDENGGEVAGFMTGLGRYDKNAEVSLTAPAVSGYNFAGWYAYDASPENAYHYFGDVLCKARTYTFTVSADTELVAVYHAIGSASVSMDGGSDYTINGELYTTGAAIEYPIGTRVTLACNSGDFAYWKNSAGVIVSRNNTYTFTVTGGESLSAVFRFVEENKAAVVFTSYYGQVMAREELEDNGSMTVPGVPFRYGFTALGWDFDGDGAFDADRDTLEAAIARGFASEDRTVSIAPVYSLKDTYYTITVTNGMGSGSYRQNDIVTAVANAAAAGQKFSHWQDAEGDILSYNETYCFYAAKDTTVNAVYTAEDVQIDKTGTSKIVDVQRDTDGRKITFVSMSTVPDGCRIEKAGVIATDDAAVGESGDGFNALTAKYVRGDAWGGNAYRYSWTVGGLTAGKTMYVRAYLVYTDADGNVNTIYGDMVSQTY